MKTQSIEIDILDSTSDFVVVKLPFLDIPVQMTHQFFQPRLESGYFRVRNDTDHFYSGPTCSQSLQLRPGQSVIYKKMEQQAV